MHETGSSEVEARQHIRKLIDATWKRMNEDLIAHSPFFPTFIQIALNLARMAQCMYQHGDGHGIEHQETKDRVSLLLVTPIPDRPPNRIIERYITIVGKIFSFSIRFSNIVYNRVVCW